MRVIQWNLCSFNAQIDYLNLLISYQNPSILAIQEKRFKQNQFKNLCNYNIFFKNRNEAAGGVAIYIKSDIHAVQIQIQSQLEVVAVKITTDKTITICNLYIPPTPFTIDKSDIENIISQITPPFILLGDFNAKNFLYGYCNDLNDHRGEIIEDILDTNSNLFLLNNGSPTHYCQRSGKESAIDLTFTSSSILNQINWTPLADLCNSDH